MRDIFHCVSTIILNILEKRNSNKALIRKHWHKTSREFIYSYMVIQQRSRWKPYITLPQRVERLKRRCASRRVFFCTALPRFMFVLISGSLKTKWKFVSAVSGSREGGLLLLQQKPGATCGAMAGTPGTHLGQPQGASGGQPKVQTLKWVHSDKAAVQVRVRSSDDDECQIQFHAHSDKCKVKLGLHSLGWGSASARSTAQTQTWLWWSCRWGLQWYSSAWDQGLGSELKWKVPAEAGQGS